MASIRARRTAVGRAFWQGTLILVGLGLALGASAYAQEADLGKVESCDPCLGAGGYGAGGYGTGGYGTGGYGTGAGAAGTGAYGAAGGAGAAGPGAGAAPFIQGDAGFACGVVRYGEFDAVLGHPFFGCSRLNLAENGSPMPVDRAFVVYRHFQDAIATDIFSTEEEDNSASLSVDRVTFGLEKTMFCGLMSLELRVPFNNQLVTNIYIQDDQDDSHGTIPVSSEEFALGNVGFALKARLYQRCDLAISAGFGVKLPTGNDVTIDVDVDNDYFEFGEAEIDADFHVRSIVANETVDITPFIGFSYVPRCRPFFSQGFLQIDIPVNPTHAVVGVDGWLEDEERFELSGVYGAHDGVELSWQTLMRLNLQLGYYLYRNPCGYVNSVAGLCEFHYTTTLNDANTLEETLIYGSDLDYVTGEETPTHESLTIQVGNLANRVDIANVVLATAIGVGKTEITPGFTIPLSTGDNKPFDWEFALMINRRF